MMLCSHSIKRTFVVNSLLFCCWDLWIRKEELNLFLFVLNQFLKFWGSRWCWCLISRFISPIGFGLCRKIQRFPLPLFLSLCSFSNIIIYVFFFYNIIKNIFLASRELEECMVWFGVVSCVFEFVALYVMAFSHSLPLFLFLLFFAQNILYFTFSDFYVVLLLARVLLLHHHLNSEFFFAHFVSLYIYRSLSSS